MEFILDSADIKLIKELNHILSVTGVTTNPTIISNSGKEVKELILELDTILSEEQLIFVQVVKTDFEGIMEEAKWISSLRPINIFVKIPVTHEGLCAIKECKKLGIPTLATTIYTAEQGFMTAMNGASYLAPYVNRMDSYGDGVGQVKDLIEMLKIHEMEAKVVAASFKNVRQVHELLCAGIQAVTVPCDIAYKMIGHPATEIAVKEFSDTWEKTYHRQGLF